MYTMCVHLLRPVYTQLQGYGYIYTKTQVLTHPCVTPTPISIDTSKNENRHCNRMTTIVLINWFECNQVPANPDKFKAHPELLVPFLK